MFEIVRYAQSYKNYFWQWEEDNSFLSIPYGSTIAHREYIRDILQLLHPQGIPSFGTLLLTLIATNPSGYKDLFRLESAIDSLYRKEIFYNRGNGNQLISSSFSFLNKLSDLPPQYKEGRKRLLMLQAIFEFSHNKISTKRAEHIYTDFKYNKIPSINFTKEHINSVIIQKDFRPLVLLDSKFPDTESIIKSITDLPEIQAMEIESLSIPGKDLIQELIDNDKTFHVGSLIKNIRSGLDIPRYTNVPGRQPLGGVSDISNKGELDKLLISEFANDSLVFLTRLANNEALYLNREIPPQNSTQKRIVLIDVSIRNWGTPKIIAYAALTALAKHPKTKIEYNAYAVGKHCHPVSYESADAIIDALDITDGCLNAYNGLSEFFTNNKNTEHETVLITTHNAVKYAEMQQLLNDNRARINYLIYTDQEGKIEMFRQLKKSRKHLQSIHLPLDDLWRKNKPHLSEDKSASAWSDILRFLSRTEMDESLLFTPRLDTGKLLFHENEIFCICNRILYKRIDNNKGWKIISKNIQKGLITAHPGYDENKHLLLFTCSNNNNLEIININTGKSKNRIQKKHGITKETKFLFKNGFFYFYNNYNASSFPSISQINADLEISVVNQTTITLGDILEIENRKTPYIQNTGGIITNLKSVDISPRNELIINKKHVLKFHSEKTGYENYDYISLEYYQSSLFDNQPKETAQYKNKVLTLRNGVTFECFREILKISFKDGQIAHIPLVKDKPLAIALDNNIIGNPYFYENKPFIQDAEPIKIKFTSAETWN